MPDLDRIVDQQLHGVRVKGMDGTETVHKPFTAAFAVEMDLLVTEANEGRASPRQVVEKFFGRYPELRGEISQGDVLEILPGFFWATSGAAVVVPARTGAANGGTTASPPAAAPTST